MVKKERQRNQRLLVGKQETMGKAGIVLEKANDTAQRLLRFAQRFSRFALLDLAESFRRILAAHDQESQQDVLRRQRTEAQIREGEGEIRQGARPSASARPVESVENLGSCKGLSCRIAAVEDLTDNRLVVALHHIGRDLVLAQAPAGLEGEIEVRAVLAEMTMGPMEEPLRIGHLIQGEPARRWELKVGAVGKPPVLQIEA